MGSEEGSAMDARRFPELEGGYNFRDLGGYRTVGEQNVRWGRLFRSGSMNKLTLRDYHLLGRMGIRCVCDLRSNREREANPTVLPESTPIDYWARDYEGSSSDLIAQIRRVASTPEQMRERMLKAYRRLPYEQAPAYRELFHRVASGALPMIFNCVAGKDRTGIAAALLLSALGVPRETVIADYVVTERCFRQLRDRLTERATDRLSDIDPSVWAPILHSDRAYIEAMFAQIEHGDGDIEAYLAKSLDVDEPLLHRLRYQLLENGGDSFTCA
jgi:protein-tyrosine phosphatase